MQVILDQSKQAIAILKHGTATVNSDDHWKRQGGILVPRTTGDSVEVAEDFGATDNMSVDSDGLSLSSGTKVDEVENVPSKKTTSLPTSVVVRNSSNYVVKPRVVVSSIHTLDLNDAGKFVLMAGWGNTYVIIPNDSSVNFDVGQIIAVDSYGAGNTTIQAATGVYINGITGTYAGGEITDNKTRVRLQKIGANEWEMVNLYQRRFDPTDLDIDSWYDASEVSTIFDTDGDVYRWNEKTGQGRDLFQTNSQYKPRTGDSTLGGLNLVDFNGDFMSLLTEETGIRSAVYVTTNLQGSAQNPVVSSIFGEEGPRFMNYTYIRTNSDSFDVNVDGEVSTEGNAAYNGYDTNNGQNIDLGMTQAEKTGPTVFYSDYDVPVGFYDLGQVESYQDFNLIGSIAEIAFFKFVLTTEQRHRLEGYFAWKWSIADIMNPAHPYKLAPPQI